MSPVRNHVPYEIRNFNTQPTLKINMIAKLIISNYYSSTEIEVFPIL